MKDHYHTELEAYRGSVESYSLFALTMLRNSFDAFLALDRKRACEIALGKEYLSIKADQLEEQGLQFIALHQPVASDLRTISCCMNLITSAERIGRYGKDICHCTYKLTDTPHIEGMMGLDGMAKLTLSMLEDVLTAFQRQDLSIIRGFSERDDQVDRMRYLIYEDCIRVMENDPTYIPVCATYLLVDRYLERCADHACKTAEKVHYMVTGEHVDIR